MKHVWCVLAFSLCLCHHALALALPSSAAADKALVVLGGEELVLYQTQARVQENWSGEARLLWRGMVAGDPSSRVLLVRDQNTGLASGWIETRDEGWYLAPGAEGLEVVELGEQSFGRCGAEELHADTLVPLTHLEVTEAVETIDIMVWYSPRAKAGAGGVAEIEIAIEAAVAALNDDVLRSGISAQFELLAIREYSTYDESDPERSGSQYAFDSNSESWAWREEFQADLVAGIVESHEDPSVCGVGSLFSGSQFGYSSRTLRGCLAGRTLSHEIGHNLGGRHDPDNSTTREPPLGLPNVAYGHFSLDEPTFGTIMSYQGAPRNLHFSNPNVFWEGVPTGTPERHNALVMNLTAPVVANFRGPCVDTSVAPCLLEDRFRVSVQWNTANESGFGQVATTSDDSAVLYFFNENNWEMLFKVLDGCSINDHFWVFFAATTDVGFRVTVTDTLTGESKEYVNRLGQAADAVTDTEAFGSCDA